MCEGAVHAVITAGVLGITHTGPLLRAWHVDILATLPWKKLTYRHGAMREPKGKLWKTNSFSFFEYGVVGFCGLGGVRQLASVGVG